MMALAVLGGDQHGQNTDTALKLPFIISDTPEAPGQPNESAIS